MSKIRFSPQGIPLTATSGETRLAPGVIGEGTGLGYYQTAEENYILVHLQSGDTLGTNVVQSQGQVQAWLEEVALLTDWSRSGQDIRNDPVNSILQVEIAQAWSKAKGAIN